MKIKFSGYFSEFRNPVPVKVQVPPYIFANTLNYADIKAYVVPAGSVWTVKNADFVNKKIVGETFANIAGFEPFAITHEFDFDDVNIDLSRSTTFYDPNDGLEDQSAALLRSALDNLLAYHDARDEIISHILHTYIKFAPKLKSLAPWTDR